jgi:hypothetical protein
MPSLRNHTHCQVAQESDTQTKTCQRECLPQHTGRLRKIKHENLTINIRNPGGLVNLDIKAFNKQSSGLIEKCLEIPHYAYSSRSTPTR